MSFLNIYESIEKAQKRLGSHGKALSRRTRSDRGKSRMPPAIQKELEKLLAGQERMPVRTILKKLQAVCRKTGASLPARASLYHFMAGAPTPEYHPSTLPQGAKNALYNLAPDVPVPGHQLAFYCFNYGDLEALHFASGLPWLSLYQASLMRGFRAKSRGLLEAVLRARGIIRKGENKS